MRCFVLAGLALGVSLLLAPAAPAATPPPVSSQANVAALQRAHAAVVGIEVRAVDGARSAQTLGLERSGSGVLIGDDGLVLTIGYLLLEAQNVQLITPGNRRLPARVVAYDLATGFGLLRPLLPLRGATAAPMGSARELRVGEPMVAAAGGSDGGVVLTRLVNTRPFSGYWEYHIEQAVFTSPPIGNHSGAPLFNHRGELVGIGSLFVGDAAGAQQPLPGNMFVPVDLLKPILAELERNGASAASRRPWLGVTSTEAGGEVRVARVNPESPAEAAGLRAGMVVLAVDAQPVATLEAFYKRVWARPSPTDEVRLTVRQGGQTRDVTVKPVDRMSTMAKPAGI